MIAQGFVENETVESGYVTEPFPSPALPVTPIIFHVQKTIGPGIEQTALRSIPYVGQAPSQIHRESRRYAIDRLVSAGGFLSATGAVFRRLETFCMIPENFIRGKIEGWHESPQDQGAIDTAHRFQIESQIPLLRIRLGKGG